MTGEVERPTRQLRGIGKIIISVVALALCLFQLYTAGFGLLVAIKQRTVHLLFVLVLTFLMYPARRESRPKVTLFDAMFCLTSVLSLGYLVIEADTIALRGGIPTGRDIFFSVIVIILVFEAARRAIGLQLMIIAGVVLIYAYFGPYMPGPIIHPGFTVKRLVDHLVVSTEGIFGVALGVSATFLFTFIFLSALLRVTGLDKLFADVAISVAGGLPGGPAQIAVVSSAAFGTISGSAVANVVGTGSFTIPLMKRVGYEPHFAAAVEAAASTGGQIMPPIMGAAAFLMPEFTGISYARIAIGAVIPALLYFLACGAAINFRALKIGLKGLPKEERPRLGEALKRGAHLLIPLIGVVYLLAEGYTPLYAGFYTIVLAVVISYFRRHSWLTLRRFLEATLSAAHGVLEVALACAVIGVIIGVFSLTGTALTISSPIVQLGSHNLFLALLLTAVILIFMGMGLPTTICYLLMATIAAPALVNLGIPVLAAHMFVFYLALLALVTPPVCLAAYAAAGIAGASPSKVGWTAARLAIAGYIVPFMFVYSPAFLLIGSPGEIILAAITGIIGVITLGAGCEGYLLTRTAIWERVVLITAALLLIKPGWITDLIGMVLLSSILVIQLKRIRVARRSLD